MITAIPWYHLKKSLNTYFIVGLSIRRAAAIQMSTAVGSIAENTGGGLYAYRLVGSIAENTGGGLNACR